MDTGIVIFILIAFIAVGGFIYYDHRNPLHPNTRQIPNPTPGK